MKILPRLVDGVSRKIDLESMMASKKAILVDYLMKVNLSNVMEDTSVKMHPKNKFKEKDNLSMINHKSKITTNNWIDGDSKMTEQISLMDLRKVIYVTYLMRLNNGKV